MLSGVYSMGLAYVAPVSTIEGSRNPLILCDYL